MNERYMTLTEITAASKVAADIAWYLDNFEINRALYTASERYCQEGNIAPAPQETLEERYQKLLVLQEYVSPAAYNMGLAWIVAGHSIQVNGGSRYLGVVPVEVEESFVFVADRDLYLDSKFDGMKNKYDMDYNLLMTYGNSYCPTKLPKDSCLTVQRMGLTDWLRSWNDLAYNAPREIGHRVMQFICWEIDVFACLLDNDAYNFVDSSLDDYGLDNSEHDGEWLFKEYLEHNAYDPESMIFFDDMIICTQPDWNELLKTTPFKLKREMEMELIRASAIVDILRRNPDLGLDGDLLEWIYELSIDRGIVIVDLLRLLLDQEL